MNALKKLFTTFKSFFLSEIQKISRLDGMEGLSPKDIDLLLRKVSQAQIKFEEWYEKKQFVEDWLRRTYTNTFNEGTRNVINEKTVSIIVYLAVQLAKKKGII